MKVVFIMLYECMSSKMFYEVSMHITVMHIISICVYSQLSINNFMMHYDNYMNDDHVNLNNAL